MREGERQKSAKKLFEAGIRQAEIAKRLRIDKSTVAHWAAKWRKAGIRAPETLRRHKEAKSKPLTETRAGTRLNPALTADEMGQPLEKQQEILVQRQAETIEGQNAEIAALKHQQAQPPTAPPQQSLDDQVDELVRTYFSVLPPEDNLQEKIRKSIMDEMVGQHNKAVKGIVQQVYKQIFAIGSAAYTNYWPRAQALGKTDLYSWLNEALSFWEEYNGDVDTMKAKLKAYERLGDFLAIALRKRDDIPIRSLAYFMLSENFRSEQDA